MRQLILGGVRSGKSRLAERLLRESGLSVVYLATARMGSDAELDRRIDAHRQRREAGWRTVEAPLALADALAAHDGPHTCLLVDCLTLWLTNLLCEADAHVLVRERDALLDLVPRLRADIVLVSNETGLGVVPMGELARRFVDEAGELHQDLGRLCDRVIFTAAGIPLCLKGPSL